MARREPHADPHEEIRALETEIQELEREVRRLKHKNQYLAVDYLRTQKERDDLQRKLAAVHAGPGDVWRWQGDGDDHPESLACPVVMLPEQLHKLIGQTVQVGIDVGRNGEESVFAIVICEPDGTKRIEQIGKAMTALELFEKFQAAWGSK